MKTTPSLRRYAWLLSLASVISVVLLWQWDVSDPLIPRPSNIFIAANELIFSEGMLRQLGSSAGMFSIGYGLAVVGGILLGILLAGSWVLNALVGFYFSILDRFPWAALPAVATAYMAVFGVSWMLRPAFVCLCAMPSIVVGSRESARRWQAAKQALKVATPADANIAHPPASIPPCLILPPFVTGLRKAITRGFLAFLVVESTIGSISSTEGIVYALNSDLQLFNFPATFAIAMVITGVIWVVTGILRIVESDLVESEPQLDRILESRHQSQTETAQNSDSIRDQRDFFTIVERHQGHLSEENWSRRGVRLAIGCVCLCIAVGMFVTPLLARYVPGCQIPLPMLANEIIFRLGAMLTSILFLLIPGFFQRSALVTLRKDDRYPVIYLRSFAADVRVADSWSEIAWSILFNVPESAELALGRGVRLVGPLVTFGQPNELIKPRGAVRLYVDEKNWKQLLIDIVAAAELVILRIGRTEGFWWEFKHLFEHCNPENVLIYVPKKDRKTQYPYFSARAKSIIDRPFPHDLGAALFVGFDREWRPQLIRYEGPSWRPLLRRRFLIGSSAPAVLEALAERQQQVGREGIYGNEGKGWVRTSRGPCLRFLLREWVALAAWILSGFAAIVLLVALSVLAVLGWR
jgi:ABC-type nitrate/sulfonate/bicarbonate transport system permease component